MALPAWSDAFWSNWALVLVGIAASYLALRSLRIIKTQTRHTEQQVKEMQASSKQTDKLIEQAAKQAAAAKDAANSALVNAQAVVNSERAWVMNREGRDRPHVRHQHCRPSLYFRRLNGSLDRRNNLGGCPPPL